MVSFFQRGLVFSNEWVIGPKHSKISLFHLLNILPGIHTKCDWSKTVGALVSREGRTRDVVPTMDGEDFAFLAEAVPSMFFFVRQGTGGDKWHHIPRTDYGLHHPSFAPDEEVLPIGVELHANLALRSLKQLSLVLAMEEMTTAEEL